MLLKPASSGWPAGTRPPNLRRVAAARTSLALGQCYDLKSLLVILRMKSKASSRWHDLTMWSYVVG